MKKKKTVFLIIAGLAVLAAGLVGYRWYHQAATTSGVMTAKITNITLRPNRAEDGYYGIEVKSAAGHKYIIDATGYMNTPMRPEGRGESCVTVPELKTGQQVEFNLPKSDDSPDTFITCYKQGAGAFFIRVK